MRIAGITGMALALGACATQRVPGPPPASAIGYSCTVVREGPQGRLRLVRGLDAAGIPDSAMIEWRWTQGGLTMGVAWGEEIEGRPKDENLVTLELETGPQPGSGMRLEVWRDGPRPAAPGVTGDWRQVGSARVHAIVRLDALRGIAGQGMLVVAAVDREGKVRARQSVDVALLAAPRAMLDAALPELDAMRADFRNRCEPVSDEEIIVT